jgi:class 3 adenylate cyclase
VTAAVRDRSGDSFSFEELPPQEVRGIDGRLSIFAVQDETLIMTSLSEIVSYTNDFLRIRK